MHAAGVRTLTAPGAADAPALTYRGRVARRRGAETEVHQLTSARRPHSVDQRDRQVRYLISMTIRIVCFGLAIVVDGPLRWFFLVGAIFLPYVAVVFANAGRETGGPGPLGPVAPARPALTTGGAEQVPWTPATGPTVRQDAAPVPPPARSGTPVDDPDAGRPGAAEGTSTASR
jgi:hypothetical protein